MFSELTGEDLYAEMIMQRTNDRRNFLIVEGDGDISVFDRFLAPDLFVAIPAAGKKSAKEALALAFADGFHGVYSVLDRDWKGLIPGEIEDWRIVYTDQYDLDMCVFFSGAYSVVASGYCVRGGYRSNSEGCTEEDIQKVCLEMSFPLGVLRYVSERRGLKLRLRDFPLHEVVAPGGFSVDLNRLVSVAQSRSKGCTAPAEEILFALREAMAEIDNPARYCSGHDVARAFAILMRRRWATVVSAEAVEKAARVTVHWEKFKRFSVYGDCASWFEGDVEQVWRSEGATG
ncbi:hypothetical protein ACFXEL_00790 [Streptomyces sp. NPDC059382]|uniref:hypothetical protein n=1 Tax=Streptomyces sp. NPDC059382 TaxID=3346816 RepID=UPI0036C06427